jgi:4-hydroxybenzoate polyprenyltransferase
MTKAKSLIALTRPKQWIKNIFVILPFLFIANDIASHDLILGFQMVLIFALASSSVYCFNDIYDAALDKSENRMHRPIAMGRVSPREAKVLSFLLMSSSIALCLNLAPNPSQSLIILFFYISINFVYSKFELKKYSSVGLMIVASGFPLRFLFGTVFLNLEISYWALIMLLYLSLFLLAGKRLSRRNQRTKQRNDEINRNPQENLEAERDFWNSIFVILGAASIASYLAFLADGKTQEHWGSSISLFSVVPYSIFVLNYFENVVKQKQLGDATENIATNLSFLALGSVWCLIMLAARLSQLQ